MVSLRVGLIVRVYQITIVTGRGYDAYASCLAGSGVAAVLVRLKTTRVNTNILSAVFLAASVEWVSPGL